MLPLPVAIQWKCLKKVLFCAFLWYMGIGNLAVGQTLDQIFSLKPQGSLPSLTLYAEFDAYTVEAGSVHLLTVHGEIPQGWYIYSVQKQGEDGPHPTELLAQSQWHVPRCCVEESLTQNVVDDVLQMRLAVHKNRFRVTQKIQIVAKTPEGTHDLQGKLRYQICDNNICAPLQTQSFVAPLYVTNPLFTKLK